MTQQTIAATIGLQPTGSRPDNDRGAMVATGEDAAKRAAIEAAVRVVAHLVADYERATHLKLLIVVTGQQFRYEVTKGSPNMELSTG